MNVDIFRIYIVGHFRTILLKPVEKFSKVGLEEIKKMLEQFKLSSEYTI